MPLFPDRLRFGIHAGQQYTDFPSYLEGRPVTLVARETLGGHLLQRCVHVL